MYIVQCSFGARYNVQCTKVQGTVYNVPCPSDTQYILSEPVKSKLPKGVRNIPSRIRNLNILKVINNDSTIKFSLYAKDNKKWITATDEENKLLLMTSTTPSQMKFIEWPAIQKAIGCYIKGGYKILLWCDEKLYEVKAEL